MKNMLVSIIVPVYNTQAYFSACIDSLLQQTHQNLEICLIDDGSQDAVSKKCDDYSLFDSRISVIHKKNSGVASSRNAGLDFVKGENLLFVDSDDKISPNFVNDMLQPDSAKVISLCYCMRWYGDDSVAPYANNPSEYVIKRPTKWILSCCRGMYFRRVLEKKHLRFITNRRAGEDQEFLYKYLISCDCAKVISEAKYYYRCNTGSAMYSLTYAHFDAVEALKDTVKYAEENGTEEQARQYREDLLYHNAIRTIEFASVTVLTAGESPKKLFAFLKEKGYHRLVGNAFSQPTHYDSAFYKLYRISPMLCFYAVRARKAVGRVLRKWKLIQ